MDLQQYTNIDRNDFPLFIQDENYGFARFRFN